MNRKRHLPISVNETEQAKKQKLDDQLETSKSYEEQMDPLAQGMFENEVNAKLKQFGAFWIDQILDNANAISKYREKDAIDSLDIDSALETFNSIPSDHEKELEKARQLRIEKINNSPLPEFDFKKKFHVSKERSHQISAEYRRLSADEAASRGITEQMRNDFYTQRQYKAINQFAPTVTTTTPNPIVSSSIPMFAAPLQMPIPISANSTFSKPNVLKPIATTISKPIASTEPEPIVLQPSPKKLIPKVVVVTSESASPIVSTPLVRLQPQFVRPGMQIKRFTLKPPAVFKVPQSAAPKIGTPGKAINSQKKSIPGPYIYGQMNNIKFSNPQKGSSDAPNLTRQSIKKEEDIQVKREDDTQVKREEDTHVKKQLSDESHFLL